MYLAPSIEAWVSPELTKYLNEKAQKTGDYDKKILIEFNDYDNHINITFDDNGIGFKNFDMNKKEILNPYFTTKKNGTGLGLSIVNKIINDHNGKLEFLPILDGAKIVIIFRLDVDRNFDSWW